MSTTFHSTSLYPTTYNAQTFLDYQTTLDIIQNQLNVYSANLYSTSPSTPFHILNPDCAHHATSIALILSYFHPTSSIILSPYSIIFSVRTLQNLKGAPCQIISLCLATSNSHPATSRGHLCYIFISHCATSQFHSLLQKKLISLSNLSLRLV